MSGQRRGGEAGGARLLELARRELLEVLLPQLQGDGRYRARLIANAMKISARGLESREEADEGAAAESLRSIAVGVGLVATGGRLSAEAEVVEALCLALREGRLDGRQDLYDLIVRMTGSRRSRIA